MSERASQARQRPVAERFRGVHVRPRDEAM